MGNDLAGFPFTGPFAGSVMETRVVKAQYRLSMALARRGDGQALPVRPEIIARLPLSGASRTRAEGMQPGSCAPGLAGLPPLASQAASLDRESCERLSAAWAGLRAGIAQAHGPDSLPVLLNAARVGERLSLGGAELAIQSLEALSDKVDTLRLAWERLRTLEASLEGLAGLSGDQGFQALTIRRHAAVAGLAGRQQEIRERTRGMRGSWSRVLRKALVLAGLSLRSGEGAAHPGTAGAP